MMPSSWFLFSFAYYFLYLGELEHRLDSNQSYDSTAIFLSLISGF